MRLQAQMITFRSGLATSIDQAQGCVIARRPWFFRVAAAFLILAFVAPPARAMDWGPRDDVGVAAVDTRTGKVMWEAWRLAELPAGVTQEEKTAVDYLLTESR